MSAIPVVELPAAAWKSYLGAEDARAHLYQINTDHLASMARRALGRGLAADEILVVCIDVDDPAWTDLAEALMPEEDWQQYRDRGMVPTARGIVMAEPLQGYLSEVVPPLRDGLLDGPPDGHVLTVVMAKGGATLFTLDLRGPVSS